MAAESITPRPHSRFDLQEHVLKFSFTSSSCKTCCSSRSPGCHMFRHPKISISMIQLERPFTQYLCRIKLPRGENFNDRGGLIACLRRGYDTLQDASVQLSLIKTGPCAPFVSESRLPNLFFVSVGPLPCQINVCRSRSNYTSYIYSL